MPFEMSAACANTNHPVFLCPDIAVQILSSLEVYFVPRGISWASIEALTLRSSVTSRPIRIWTCLDLTVGFCRLLSSDEKTFEPSQETVSPFYLGECVRILLG